MSEFLCFILEVVVIALIVVLGARDVIKKNCGMILEFLYISSV